jgi:hypothetical protein
MAAERYLATEFPAPIVLPVTRSLILVVGACTLAACGSSAAARSETSGAQTAVAHCGPAAARTLAASSQARVYTRSRIVYGCAAGGRSFILGRAGLCVSANRVGPVAVAGRLAAYAIERCGVDTSSATVVVRRLSDGRSLFAHAGSSLPPGPESFESVGSIAVSGGGGAAWIASLSSIVSHQRHTQVLERAGARTRVLATGSDIASGSLRRKGNRVTWRQGGSTRAAALH